MDESPAKKSAQKHPQVRFSKLNLNKQDDHLMKIKIQGLLKPVQLEKEASNNIDSDVYH